MTFYSILVEKISIEQRSGFSQNIVTLFLYYLKQYILLIFTHSITVKQHIFNMIANKIFKRKFHFFSIISLVNCFYLLINLQNKLISMKF